MIEAGTEQCWGLFNENGRDHPKVGSPPGSRAHQARTKIYVVS